MIGERSDLAGESNAICMVGKLEGYKQFYDFSFTMQSTFKRVCIKLHKKSIYGPNSALYLSKMVMCGHEILSYNLV